MVHLRYLVLCFYLLPCIAALSFSQGLSALSNIEVNPGRSQTLDTHEHDPTHHRCDLSECSMTGGPGHVEARVLDLRADSGLPVPVPRGFSPAQLWEANQMINEVAEKWRTTQNGRGIDGIFQRLVHLPSLQIKNCVVIALGTFTDRLEDLYSDFKNTIQQLAAFKVLLEITSMPFTYQLDMLKAKDGKMESTGLGTGTSSSQTQSLTISTRQFHRSRGYTILEDPHDAQRHISRSTFLFEPFGLGNVLIARITINPPSIFLGSSPLFIIQQFEDYPE